MTIDNKDRLARYIEVSLNGVIVPDVVMAYSNPLNNDQGFIEVNVWNSKGELIVKENDEPATVTLSGIVQFHLIKEKTEDAANTNTEEAKPLNVKITADGADHAMDSLRYFAQMLPRPVVFRNPDRNTVAFVFDTVTPDNEKERKKKKDA